MKRGNVYKTIDNKMMGMEMLKNNLVVHYLVNSLWLRLCYIRFFRG